MLTSLQTACMKQLWFRRSSSCSPVVVQWRPWCAERRAKTVVNFNVYKAACSTDRCVSTVGDFTYRWCTFWGKALSPMMTPRFAWRLAGGLTLLEYLGRSVTTPPTGHTRSATPNYSNSKLGCSPCFAPCGGVCFVSVKTQCFDEWAEFHRSYRMDISYGV